MALQLWSHNSQIGEAFVLRRKINTLLELFKIEGPDVESIQANDSTFKKADKLGWDIGAVHEIPTYGEILEH